VTADFARLEACLDDISSAPRDSGTVEMIVIRPRENEREVRTEVWLDAVGGVEGDSWAVAGVRRIASPDPEAQVTVMNARVLSAIAGDRKRWPLAGDQLYVDLDISVDNLSPGSLVQIGDAVVEVSAQPHTGCKKFSSRYGIDALRFVSTPEGRSLRLRGANCKVVVSGLVHVGDTIRKLSANSRNLTLYDREETRRVR
jgi:MOSC domain-containing protein YiiM